MSFSNEQIQAINHINGPAMVLAGPGSGKTTVITQRLLNLLSLDIPSEDILVITFTKDAAQEMETRFNKLAKEKGREGHRITFGTFHSVFFFILRLRYNLSFKNIISDRTKVMILRELTMQEHIDSSYDMDFFRLLLSEISKFKSLGKNTSGFTSKLIDTDKFLRIIEQYRQELRTQRLVDFDDMLLLCHELFLREPGELRKWQKKYRFILVDEFQDISPVQYEIVKMLAAPENNLFIVGDDDQSIYRFRGAEPSIMMGFGKDYPDAKQIFLSNNYRSRQEIVNFAKKVISHNKQRFSKDIRAVNGPGGVTLCYRTKDPLNEYLQVLENIKKELGTGVPPEEIAVLFRTELLVHPLLTELSKLQIPYTLKNKVKNIYDSSTARDIISYIKLSLNMGSRADFLRIMNKPLRYISRKALDHRDMSFDKLKRYYSSSSEMLYKIDLLMRDLTAIRRLPTVAAIIYIRKKIGYDRFIEDNARENHINPENVSAIMDEIETSSRHISDKKEWLDFVENYGEELAKKQDGSDKGIHLMTFHGSKGLEFDVVHLVDINETIVPYRKAVSKEDIEEERRGFYVAITRARKELHIYFTDQRYSKNCSPSRFLLEAMK